MDTSFQFSNNMMSLVTGTYHVFGSGAASARLLVDGDRVAPAEDGGNNGFAGVMRSSVPLAQLAAAKGVKFHLGFSPGGSIEFCGSGRSFIRWAYKQTLKPGFFSGDPLKLSLRYRARYAEHFRAKSRRTL